jgi:hypothetical protein
MHHLSRNARLGECTIASLFAIPKLFLLPMVQSYCISSKWNSEVVATPLQSFNQRFGWSFVREIITVCHGVVCEQASCRILFVTGFNRIAKTEYVFWRKKLTIMAEAEQPFVFSFWGIQKFAFCVTMTQKRYFPVQPWPSTLWEQVHFWLTDFSHHFSKEEMNNFLKRDLPNAVSF